jgi:hypothetical protein
MYAAVHIDDVAHLQANPKVWDELQVCGSFMFWVIMPIDKVPLSLPYIELTEYEAMGWKFKGVNRGYITVYEDSNLFEQVPFEKWVQHPKKNKTTGNPILKPMRYKYTMTQEDIEQGIAFGQKMEPHVQRALKSQARREKLGRIRRFFKRM